MKIKIEIKLGNKSYSENKQKEKKCADTNK